MTILDVLQSRAEVLHTVSEQFVGLLRGNHQALAAWSPEDLREALLLITQHKELAQRALDRQMFAQALHNIDTVIYLIAGFLEGQDDATFN